MNRRGPILPLLAGTALVVLLSLSGCITADSSGVSASAKAPQIEIAVYQGADVLGGQVVTFTEVLARGRPVVLNMWAGLCPACRTEMPMLQRAYERYGGSVLVLGLDVGSFTGLGSEQDAHALLEELAITFPAGAPSDAAVMREYGVIGMPSTYFIKPDGEIVQRWNGILSEGLLQEYIEALLEGSAGS
ncbi:MAG: TlpA disulfide reductase family protein [Anaerolineae bacterium]